jgi:DNA polymerase III epsilon subunit-like protein
MWYITDEIPVSNFSEYTLFDPEHFYYVNNPIDDSDVCKAKGAIFDVEYVITYLDVPKDELRDLGVRWDASKLLSFTNVENTERFANLLISDTIVNDGHEFNQSDSQSIATTLENNTDDPYEENIEDHSVEENEDDFGAHFVADHKEHISLSKVRSKNFPPVDLEGKYVVFFDVETSGLPQRSNFGEFSPFRKFAAYDSCRIVQICAVLCKAECFSKIETKNILIKAKDFEISKKSFEIHGISKEKTLEEGMEWSDAIENEIFPLFSQAHYVVCHNAIFDTSVLKSELARTDYNEYLDHIEGMDVICTMKKTKDIVGATDANNRLKNPKLKELYKVATGKEMIGAHDAMFDVMNMHEAIKSLVEADRLELADFYGKTE